MSLLTAIRDNIMTIAVIIVLMVIVSVVYTTFFSDQAKIIKALKELIKEQEKYISDLENRYQALQQEEQKRLQEIVALKAKLTQIQEKINQGEVNIDEIKNELMDLDSALDVIEDHTRGIISFELDTLRQPGAGADDAGTKK